MKGHTSTGNKIVMKCLINTSLIYQLLMHAILLLTDKITADLAFCGVQSLNKSLCLTAHGKEK